MTTAQVLMIVAGLNLALGIYNIGKRGFNFEDGWSNHTITSLGWFVAEYILYIKGL